MAQELVNPDEQVLNTESNVSYGCLSWTDNCLSWTDNSSNSFSVKSLYELSCPLASIPNTTFDLIWRNSAPYRIQCFVWLVHLGRIKTFDYLLKIGIIKNVADARCKFCSLHMESPDHLLLLCDPVWNLWSEILAWWGIQWVSPNSIVGLLLWWNNKNLSKGKKLIWEVIPLAILWTVWNSRNALVFENSAPQWDDIAEVVKIRVALWVKSKMGGNNFTMDDFLFRLNSILQCL